MDVFFLELSLSSFIISPAQVNAIASDTAGAMEKAARAVSELAAQAQVLTGLIEDMKRG